MISIEIEFHHLVIERLINTPSLPMRVPVSVELISSQIQTLPQKF